MIGSCRERMPIHGNASDGPACCVLAHARLAVQWAHGCGASHPFSAAAGWSTGKQGPNLHNLVGNFNLYDSSPSLPQAQVVLLYVNGATGCRLAGVRWACASVSTGAWHQLSLRPPRLQSPKGSRSPACATPGETPRTRSSRGPACGAAATFCVCGRSCTSPRINAAAALQAWAR